MVTVDAEEIQTRDADDRGRVTLGPQYAGKRIMVAVIEEVEQDD